MIELMRVTKSFQDTPVLTDISLTIQDNEVFGIVGPSELGKSTLLNCLIGLENTSQAALL